MTAASASSAPPTMPLTRHRPVLPPDVPADRPLARAAGPFGSSRWWPPSAWWARSSSVSSTPPRANSSAQNPAVNQSAQAFLTDFFNFNAKTVDADFTAVTNMATGQFATQAKQFFNSSIRQALEKALAESRGQTRALYVQSENGERGHPLRGGRPDLRQQQDHHAPGRRGPHGDQPRQRRRNLEDLRRHRARGRHAGERGLALGLGRFQRPRSVVDRPPPTGDRPPNRPSIHRRRIPVRRAVGAASPTVRVGCVRVCG